MEKIFTAENFSKEALEASNTKPVLVDFFATWCGPCKIQAPIIAEIAEELGEQAVVGKANIEEMENLANQYGVMSIPTIILFKNGEAKEVLTGLQPKERLLALIKENLTN